MENPVTVDNPIAGDSLPNGGFELLEERPPDSLLRRLYVTVRNVLGLLFGGGFAYVRERKSQGTASNFSMLILRAILRVDSPLRLVSREEYLQDNAQDSQ